MQKINLKLGDIKYPLPERIIKKFRECFKEVNLYPQNYELLVSKLAKKFNIDKANILLVNGIDGGIDLIAKVFGRRILFFAPTYFEFKEAARRNKRRYKVINSFNGQEYKINIDNPDIKKEIKKASLIFLCNPNNPFGLLTSKTILNIVKITKGIVAVDECYIDFSGKSVLKDIKNHSNLLILRSFSKGYSAAGLRLGFIVGNKRLINQLRNKKLFFDVSSPSINAALILLEERKYFKNLITDIKKLKNSFEEYLQVRGFNVIKTNNNNIIIKFLSIAKANKFYSFLLKNGVIVNQGDGISTVGLDKSWIRLACGRKEQMSKFKKIIDKFIF